MFLPQSLLISEIKHDGPTDERICTFCACVNADTDSRHGVGSTFRFVQCWHLTVTEQHVTNCDIRGFHIGAAEDLSLLGCDTVSLDERPTFRKTLSLIFSFKHSNNTAPQCWTNCLEQVNDINACSRNVLARCR